MYYSFNSSIYFNISKRKVWGKLSLHHLCNPLRILPTLEDLSILSVSTSLLLLSHDLTIIRFLPQCMELAPDMVKP